MSHRIINSVLVFIFLFLGIAGFGQKNINIHKDFSYESLDVESGAGTIKIGFTPSSGFWDELSQQPQLVVNFRLPYNDFDFTVGSLELESLSAEELSQVEVSTVRDELVFAPSVAKQDGKYFGSLEGNALLRDKKDGQVKKITAVDLVISPKTRLKNKPKSFTNSSVLSSGSGDWYKIGVAEDGLYRIDYNFLVNFGIDVNNIDPRNINIYGNGQGMLDEDNSAARIDDLSPRNIWVKGESDGIFNTGDYIVFYAKGPHDVDFSGGKMRHTTNNFTDTSYYFLNIGSSGSSYRVGNASLSSLPSTQVINKFNDLIYLEDDKFNLAKSGQEWMGDLFDVQLSKVYDFDVANLSASDSMDVGINIALSTPNSVNDAKFIVQHGSESLQVKPSTGSGQGSTSPKARLAYGSKKFRQPNSSTISLNLSMSKDGLASTKGYLDFIEINCIRNLIMEGNQMSFYHTGSVGIGQIAEFQLGNASSVKYIWEITDQISPKMVSFTPGSNVAFKVATDSLRKFIAFTDNQYLTPTWFGEVAHQNLHGLDAPNIVIITSPEFVPAAQRLAAHHKTEGLTSQIVTQQQIFNEFSSGMRDPVSIRHFLKMFYDRAGGDPTQYPHFCIIMGECSYDYRNRLNSNSDFVITYESKESMSTSTYSTDDFYVILDDSEIMRGTDLMDMAIGRMPVRSLDEANGMVDKVIAYSTQDANAVANQGCCNQTGTSIYGDWRNVVMMISDDGDGNTFFTDVENMYTLFTSTHDELNMIKVHSDAYQEIVTPGGERNPDATELIKTRVNRGALLVNYIGHGGELGWAHEEILNVPTIKGWTNSPSLPVFMTATCEFSRYDDHDRISAGEYVVLNETGGGIGLFTTTRLVYTTSNRQLARVFYDTVADKIGGQPQYIGDIYKGSKNKFANEFGSSEARKFTYLGDPAVRFALPVDNVILDSVNGIEISAFNDTLKALETVVISGHVEDGQNNLLSGFNGFVYPSIYDKISELTTLGNSSGSTPAGFEMWKNLIYKGKATVKNGRFRCEFIIPQDIAYTYGPGRFSFYAENGQIDGNGYNEQPIIGGINTNAPQDQQGPTVSLYLNDLNFVDGGITDATPMFIAQVYDDNGINMVGNGIGHNIEIRIDDESEPIVLNDYYESDVDTYKSGQVRFQMNELTPGPHIIHFKVWDVYNNSSDHDVEFIVLNEEEIAINHLLNYPNPFTTYTEFSFEHNQVCDFLDVQIQIFTISGKLVKTIQERRQTGGFRVGGIAWDGRDEYGDKIGIGTYIYKLTLVNESGEKLEKYEKLFLLN